MPPLIAFGSGHPIEDSQRPVGEKCKEIDLGWSQQLLAPGAAPHPGTEVLYMTTYADLMDFSEYEIKDQSEFFEKAVYAS